jgi:hypothetical protein
MKRYAVLDWYEWWFNHFWLIIIGVILMIGFIFFDEWRKKRK